MNKGLAGANARGYRWYEVNTSPGNGFLPSCNKPLICMSQCWQRSLTPYGTMSQNLKCQFCTNHQFLLQLTNGSSWETVEMLVGCLTSSGLQPTLFGSRRMFIWATGTKHFLSKCFDTGSGNTIFLLNTHFADCIFAHQVVQINQNNMLVTVHLFPQSPS